MGLFAKRKSKSAKVPAANDNGSTPRQKSGRRLSSKKKSSKSSKNEESEQQEAVDPIEVKLEMVPQLVSDLERCTDTSGDKPARALRMLFSLSEHANNDSQNRTAMVREADGHLIPVLLEFLRKCERGSSEQYLALLVLNNVSIPSENKRWIAMECGGAQVFSRLLCEDPSCHLMAIILVNLTFADAELRKELVRPEANMYIVESLSYALRVASLTHEEFEAREQQLPTGDSPKELLMALMDEEKRLRPALSDLDYNSGNNFRSREMLADPATMLYPETARWCLSALKNLTRPWSKDATAAHSLINSGIVPLIVRFVTVGTHATVAALGEASENDGSSPTNSSDSSPHPSNPEEMPEFTNSPTVWDSNSMQDAALFVVLNLCATPSAREYMREVDTVNLLSLIPAYRLNEYNENYEQQMDQSKLLDFQCLKAVSDLFQRWFILYNFPMLAY